MKKDATKKKHSIDFTDVTLLMLLYIWKIAACSNDHFDKYLLQPSKFPEEIPQGSLRHHGGHNLMESRRQILFKSLVQTEKCPRSGIWRPFSCAYVKVFIITCQIIYPQNTRLGTLFGFIAGSLGLFLGALIKEGCKKFSAPILHIQGVPLPTRPWPPKTGVCPVSVPSWVNNPIKHLDWV